MKLLDVNDFKMVGWEIGDQNVRALVDGIIATQSTVFAKCGITQNIHIAHLMTQISHESGDGHEMVESLNYKPSAILAQWPKHFTPAQATAYGRTDLHKADQKMIGILAYGGRMGNAPAPSEEGYQFRGRGFIQTTGKNGYAQLGTLTGLDLVNKPELVNDPDHAFLCAVTEFVSYPNMLKHCESDDLLAVSALVNVGHLVSNSGAVIGYSEREAQLRLWKHQYGF